MGVSSGSGSGLTLRPGPFNGLKVFSATMMADRAKLGETITEWLRANPQYEVTEMIVSQSSDAAFHCLSIVVFYREQQATPRRPAR